MRKFALAFAAMLALGVAPTLQAQGSGLRVQKEISGGEVSLTPMNFDWTDTLTWRWVPLDWSTCNVNMNEVQKVHIKSDLFTTGMVTPDSAKAIALCALPGQISSGEMESRDGRTVYQITLLPTDKKTHAKVVIDANTGEVLSTKEFGGVRGVAGFLRESFERKENKAKAKQDTTHRNHRMP